MGRAKAKMEMIPKPRQRIQTFNARKECLNNKLSELTTLCNIDACMIIYEPTLNKSFVWPAEDDKPDGVRNVIDSYKAAKIGKKTTVMSSGVSEFLEERNKKAEADLCKLRKTISNAKYPTWNEFYESLNESQLRGLSAELNKKAQFVASKIQMMKTTKMRMMEKQEQVKNMMLHNSAHNNSANYNNFAPVAPVNMNMMIHMPPPPQSYYIPQPTMQIAPPLQPYLLNWPPPLTLQYYTTMDQNIHYSGSN